MNDRPQKEIGRMPVVLVAEGVSEDTYISSVTVRTLHCNSNMRLSFTGISVFSDEVKGHISETVLSVVDDIVNALGLKLPDFEISIANLPAASVRNGHIKIEGFSADLAVFTAMLSSALHIPVSQNILATGHIGSVDGEIIPVRSLDLKFLAAVKSNIIDKFIYPECNLTDCPEYHRLKKTIANTSASKRLFALSDIENLVSEVFTSYDIVISSLRKEYFQFCSPNPKCCNRIAKVIRLLTDNNPNRFYQTIQNYVMVRNVQPVRELIDEYFSYYIRLRQYPSSIGTKLSAIITSVPRHIKGEQNFYPLCNPALCIKAAQFAGPNDFNDAALLLNTVMGIYQSRPVTAKPQLTTEPDSGTAFDQVICKLNQRSLAEKIDTPVDTARATFIMDKSMADSYEQFLQTIKAFMIHLQCHIDKTDINGIDPETCMNDAIELLDRTYKNEKGLRTAFLQASEGINSGLRGVIDRMADQYKYDLKTSYANRIFRESINIMSWQEKVDFMRTALLRTGHLLPDELRNQPPERFADDYEAITRALIESLDKINNIFAVS